jgi:hypothetical protein
MIEEAARTRYASSFFGDVREPATHDSIIDLVNRSRAMNGRRNDIAHGIVVNIYSSASGESLPTGWYLTSGAHNRKLDRETLRMSYAWTAAQIRYYSDGFANLTTEAISLEKIIRGSNRRH